MKLIFSALLALSCSSSLCKPTEAYSCRKCLPSATEGLFVCPWNSSIVLGNFKPNPTVDYPSCGEIIWDGGPDFIIRPRFPPGVCPRQGENRTTFSSRKWRTEHGGPQNVRLE